MAWRRTEHTDGKASNESLSVDCFLHSLHLLLLVVGKDVGGQILTLVVLAHRQVHLSTRAVPLLCVRVQSARYLAGRALGATRPCRRPCQRLDKCGI